MAGAYCREEGNPTSLTTRIRRIKIEDLKFRFDKCMRVLSHTRDDRSQNSQEVTSAQRSKKKSIHETMRCRWNKLKNMSTPVFTSSFFRCAVKSVPKTKAQVDFAHVCAFDDTAGLVIGHASPAPFLAAPVSQVPAWAWQSLCVCMT